MKVKTMKELREEAGYTQIQVAERTETTVQYISLLERGLRNPSDKMKEKLAKLYKKSIAEIFLSVQQTKCFTKI